VRWNLAIVAAGAVVGCGGERAPAIGSGSEIVVLSAAPSRAMRERVADMLSREVQLVQAEPTFDVVEADLADRSSYERQKLLFAVGTSGDEGIAKLLRGAAGAPTRSGVPGLWVVTEPFAAGQVLFVLSGEAGALGEVLGARDDEILAVVEDAAVTLALTNLYRDGEIPGARDEMLAVWGWGVRVPPDWQVDRAYARERFVRVWRDAPVEQLFVAWEEGRVERTPGEWIARRGELVERFYDGDAVVPDRSRGGAAVTPWGGDGVHLAGLWQNEKWVIGGPYRSWAFWCAEDGRTYLVDICAYAPDRPKRPLLRTLEAVARTFRCGCVPAPGRGEPS
jgi:hypothetical protein